MTKKSESLWESVTEYLYPSPPPVIPEDDWCDVMMKTLQDINLLFIGKVLATASLLLLFAVFLFIIAKLTFIVAKFFVQIYAEELSSAADSAKSNPIYLFHFLEINIFSAMTGISLITFAVYYIHYLLTQSVINFQTIWGLNITLA